MAIVATPKTAAYAGAWTVIGIVTFDAWEKHHPLDVATHNVIFVGVLVVFFFVPGLIFVIGPQWMRAGLRGPFNRDYWIAFRTAALRMFCWFLSAGAVGMLYSVLLNWLYEI